MILKAAIFAILTCVSSVGFAGNCNVIQRNVVNYNQAYNVQKFKQNVIQYKDVFNTVVPVLVPVTNLDYGYNQQFLTHYYEAGDNYGRQEQLDVDYRKIAETVWKVGEEKGYVTPVTPLPPDNPQPVPTPTPSPTPNPLPPIGPNPTPGAPREATKSEADFYNLVKLRCANCHTNGGVKGGLTLIDKEGYLKALDLAGRKRVWERVSGIGLAPGETLMPPTGELDSDGQTVVYNWFVDLIK